MGKLLSRIYEPFPRRISLNFCGCVECELGFVSSSLIAPHFCWSAPPSCVHGRASFLLPVTRGSTHPLLVNLSIPAPYKRSLTNHKLLVNLIASHWIDASPAMAPSMENIHHLYRYGMRLDSAPSTMTSPVVTRVLIRIVENKCLLLLMYPIFPNLCFVGDISKSAGFFC